MEKGKREKRPYLETPAEAARRLGLDRVCNNPELTVRRMARRGELTAVRVSKYTMIDADSVDRYILGAQNGRHGHPTS